MREIAAPKHIVDADCVADPQAEDVTYRERPVSKGWKSREGMLPSDYWRRNMFVEFMEDDRATR
jgi:hypothetical protein